MEVGLYMWPAKNPQLRKRVDLLGGGRGEEGVWWHQCNHELCLKSVCTQCVDSYSAKSRGSSNEAKRGEGASTDVFRTDGKTVGTCCQRMLWLQKACDANGRWASTEKTVVN